MFLLQCFLQLGCKKRGERFIERALCALLFPAICKWPTHEYKMLTKYKHNMQIHKHAENKNKNIQTNENDVNTKQLWKATQKFSCSFTLNNKFLT